MVQARSKNRIGLDIGSHSVKIVEISDNPERPVLLGFGMKTVYRDSSKEALATQIKSMIQEYRISGKDASISISGGSVIVRFITMPRMSDGDLKGAIRFEAEKFITFNMNDCVLGFQVLRKIEQENKLEILLVAAKKEHVEERIKIVESAGLSVRVVDVDSFALVNSFLKNFPSSGPDKTEVLLNIGASLSNLSIVKGGTMCFVRDVMIGGNDFDSAISKGLGVGLETVQDLKADPKDRMAEVVTFIKPIVNNLLDEMRLCFSYYENQYGRDIDEVYLSGGTSNLMGLEEHFQEALGLKPERWDPFQFLDKTTPGLDAELLAKAKNSFAVAVGLALR